MTEKLELIRSQIMKTLVSLLRHYAQEKNKSSAQNTGSYSNCRDNIGCSLENDVDGSKID